MTISHRAQLLNGVPCWNFYDHDTRRFMVIHGRLPDQPVAARTVGEVACDRPAQAAVEVVDDEAPGARLLCLPCAALYLVARESGRLPRVNDLAVDALACYRLTRLATTDTMPLLRHARHHASTWLSKYHPEWADLPVCEWCASIWVAAAIVAVRRARWWRPLSHLLAMSAAAGLISERA